MTESRLKRRVTTHCGIKIDSVAMVIALLNLNNLQLQKANGGRKNKSFAGTHSVYGFKGFLSSRNGNKQKKEKRIENSSFRYLH